jgi:hypothetical protein
MGEATHENSFSVACQETPRCAGNISLAHEAFADKESTNAAIFKAAHIVMGENPAFTNNNAIGGNISGKSFRKRE